MDAHLCADTNTKLKLAVIRPIAKESLAFKSIDLLKYRISAFNLPTRDPIF